MLPVVDILKEKKACWEKEATSSMHKCIKMGTCPRKDVAKTG